MHAGRMQPHAFRVFGFRPAHPFRPCASHSFERWLFTRLAQPQRLAAIAAMTVLLPAWGPGIRHTALGTKHGPRLCELRLRLREPGPHALHVSLTEWRIAGAEAVILLAGGVRPRGAHSADVLPGLGDARWIERGLVGYADLPPRRDRAAPGQLACPARRRPRQGGERRRCGRGPASHMGAAVRTGLVLAEGTVGASPHSTWPHRLVGRPAGHHQRAGERAGEAHALHARRRARGRDDGPAG